MLFIQRAVSLAALVVLFTSCLRGADSVPADFQDLYTYLDAQLTDTNTAIDSGWSGSRATVNFSAQLQNATAGRGITLLSPNLRNLVLLELTRLRSLGVKTVNISIPYPIFHQPFFDWNGNPQDCAKFLEVYKQIVADVRSFGIKIVVENGCLFTGDTFGPPGLNTGGYYPTLTVAQYVAGRAEVAATIARELRPDFLYVGAEPDTESAITGKPLHTPAAFSAMINAILTQIKAANTTVRVGAGVGTWHGQAAAFVEALCALPLDNIDLHVYPINKGWLSKAITLSDLIISRGKKVSMIEAWMNKQRDSELGSNLASDPAIFARDSYSFWAPLDQRFLLTLTKLAHWKNFEVLTPFWCRYFYAYVDYESVKSLPAGDVLDAGGTAAGEAMLAGTFTDTGRWYATLIAPAALQIADTSLLPDGSFGGAFSYRFAATGGVPGYHWSVSGGTLPPGLTLYADGTLNGTPLGSGAYSFEVQVQDELKAVTRRSLTLSVQALAPRLVSAPSAAPNPAQVGESVSFSAAASDPEGQALTFSWSFGDGGSASGAVVRHAFTVAGTYTAEVVVSNTSGLRASATVSLSVEASAGRPPRLDSAPGAAPNPAQVGESVGFSVAASDPEGQALTFSWRFGDGSSAAGESVTHAYSALGTYTAEVVVSNTSGLRLSATVSVTVVAEATPPPPPVSPSQLELSHMRGVCRFDVSGHDQFSLSGLLIGVPPLFEFSGQALVLEVGGAMSTFKLDQKGRAKGPSGASLKLKPAWVAQKGGPRQFRGGNLPFSARMQNGSFSQRWQLTDAGGRGTFELPMRISLGGAIYEGQVLLKYEAQAGKGLKFKESR